MISRVCRFVVSVSNRKFNLLEIVACCYEYTIELKRLDRIGRMEADYEIIWLGTNQSFISFFFLNAQVKERIVFLDDREWANHAKLHPSFHSFIHSFHSIPFSKEKL